MASATGLGFYRCWFYLTTGSLDHETDVTITVDRDKIRGDEEEVKKSAHKLVGKPKGKSRDESTFSECHHELPARGWGSYSSRRPPSAACSSVASRAKQALLT